MNDFALIDPSFDSGKTKEYSLSIQVGLGGFSLLILDAHQKCIALNHHQNPEQNSFAEQLNLFKESVRHSDLLNHQFSKVSVVWLSNKSVLIPSEFFSEDFAFESFQLCHDLNKAEALLWNRVDELNSWSVYSMPESYLDLILSQFPNARLYHFCYPFYKNIMQNNSRENHPPVFISIQKDFFLIMIPGHDNKHFINSFLYREETDLAYHILNVYKQQKLNTERSKLILEGRVLEESKIVQLLKRYLEQVEVKRFAPELRANSSVPPIEYNQFVNLLNLSRCE